MTIVASPVQHSSGLRRQLVMSLKRAGLIDGGIGSGRTNELKNDEDPSEG
jgi:hypothetical protein